MAHSRLIVSTRPTANAASVRVDVFRPRRRRAKTRLLLILLALAIVMLAVGGWVVQAFRAPA
jgi:hypothetical protein